MKRIAISALVFSSHLAVNVSFVAILAWIVPLGDAQWWVRAMFVFMGIGFMEVILWEPLKWSWRRYRRP